ncbi:unnamed protein product [Coregonus sp. 'balchen']|nr:unnamed protein product [Coregonus sp. 'balchen']
MEERNNTTGAWFPFDFQNEISTADAEEKRTNGDPSKSWKRSVEPKPTPCINGAVKHGELLEIIEVHSNSKNSLPLPLNPNSEPFFESRQDKNMEAKRKMAMARERKTVKTLGIIVFRDRPQSAHSKE